MMHTIVFAWLLLASPLTSGYTYHKRLLMSDPSYVHNLEVKVQELTEKSEKTDVLLKNMTAEMHQLKEQVASNRAVFHSCPNGFIRNNQSCYKIHHDILSMPEALTFCKAFGAHLFIPNSIEEYNFIRQEVTDLQGSYKVDCYWIAVSDAFIDGKWIVSESDKPATALVWGQTEPNGATGENCACMTPDQGFDLADVSCKTQYNFICEIELVD